MDGEQLQVQDPFALPLDLTIARSRVSVWNESLTQGAPVVDTLPTAYTRPDSDFQCYGGARELWNLVVAGIPQVMIHGPAETGKTTAALNLIDHLCWEHPGVQGAMVRKVGADLWPTFIPDWEKVIQMNDEGVTPSGITKYGGQKPEFYKYPNGSKIWVGGLDHPGKILSAQRDFVYTNQTEEFEQSDWETISTRTTGRAGVLRPGRLIGDCNPGPSTHWIIKLAELGTLRMVKSLHQDNPTLFNPHTGEITEQGKFTIGSLKALTGVLYKRLFQGLWVAAEGVVYQTFDPTVHVKPRPAAEIIYYVAGVDWGWKNPGVIQVWGVDGDGRMYRVHEVYQTGKLVAASNPQDAWWILKAKELKEQYGIRMFVCDPSKPDYIAAFELAGLPCEPAFNSIELGIQNIESRLVVQPDGWARIILLSGSRPAKDSTLVDKHKPTCLEEEVEVYARPKDGKGNQNKDELPVPRDNHACDTMRYVAAYVDDLGGNAFVFGEG